MAIRCLNDEIGIGERCITRNNFAQVNALFLTTPGFKFDTASDFANEAKWKENIRDKYIFPIQGILEVEGQDTDDLIYTTPTGEKIKNGDGIRGAAYKVLYDLKSHQILRGWSGKNWKIFKADRNGNIMGTSPDGTVVQGFELSYFEVMKQGMAVGTDTPAFSIIEIQEADVREWDSEGVYLNNPNFIPTQLEGTGMVTITQVGTITGNSYVVDVAYVDNVRLNGASSGADFSFAIEGALAANFQTLDGSGAVVAITGVTESTTVPGRYTVAHASFTAGTSQFKASTTLLYESSVLTLS